MRIENMYVMPLLILVVVMLTPMAAENWFGDKSISFSEDMVEKITISYLHELTQCEKNLEISQTELEEKQNIICPEVKCDCGSAFVSGIVFYIVGILIYGFALFSLSSLDKKKDKLNREIEELETTKEILKKVRKKCVRTKK